MKPSRFCPLQPFFFAIFLLTGFSACSVRDLEPQLPEQDVVENEKVSPFIPGIVSVQFDEETAAMIEQSLRTGSSIATRAPQLGGALEGMGIKSLRRVFPDAGEFEPRTRREGLHRFYYVEFDEEVPATRAAGNLAEIPGVVTVSPQIPIRPRTFNDPYFGSQWHYYNGRYKDADINVQKVWDEFTVGKNTVIVSVVDEGVYMQHEDLSANLIPCLEDGTGSYNFNNNTPTVVPTQGHGTHVAGIISAISNNGIGVAGIAGGDAAAGIPGVKVMSCQIFDLYGNQPDIYQAIKHGADHGAVILQCSWGFSPDLDGDGFTTDAEIALYRSFTIDDLPEYKAAIDYFIKYAGCDNQGNQLPDSPMKGGVAIFAAGNDNFDFDPLVCYEPIIAVGAFGATGNKASYSNYGDWLDIAAPGGDAKQGIYSTLLYNRYGGADWQGTSMACPHVSGVAALLVSYFGGPGFTAEECRTRILRGGVSHFFTGSRYIGRKLDAYGAFTCDPSLPAQAPVIQWTGECPPAIGYKDVVEVPFTVTDPLGLETWVTLTPDIPGITLVKDSETAYRLVLDAEQLKGGSFSVKVEARNEDGATSSLTYAFEILPNRAPVVRDPVSTVVIGGPGESETFSVGDWFSDPDGDPLTFEATLEDPSVASVSLDGNGTLSLQGLHFGGTRMVVKASDGTLAAQFEVPVAVKNPEGPFVYPTRATTALYVGVNELETVPVSVTVTSYTGATVGSWDMKASLFYPMRLSVGGFAPGVYMVKITCKDTTRTLSFVKV